MKEASKKKSFDYEQETLQLQDDGGDEDVSVTTDEKLSIWKKSFSGAEDKAKPPPVKPRKPTPHTRNEHEYEDPATFQSDSWFSDELDGGQQPKRSAKSAKPTKFEASVEDFSKDASFDDREKAVARSPSYPGSEEKSVSDEKSPYSRSSAHVDHREVQGGGSAVSAQLKSIEKKLGEVMSQISKIKERQIIFEEELFNITQRKASSAPEALPGVVAGMSPADVSVYNVYIANASAFSRAGRSFLTCRVFVSVQPKKMLYREAFVCSYYNCKEHFSFWTLPDGAKILKSPVIKLGAQQLIFRLHPSLKEYHCTVL